MRTKAIQSYSEFKAQIPPRFRTRRRPEMTEFREIVGAQARLFRNLHLPATNKDADRHQRWQDWLTQIHFDDDWEVIRKIDDDVVNEMAQGRRNVVFAIAVYYRLHAELDDLRYAEVIDHLLFGAALKEQGKAVFAEAGESLPTSSPTMHAQPHLFLRLVDAGEETRFLYRSRAIPYIEPERAFRALDEIIADRDRERAFVWHVLYGPGGSGKSRLALEYALRRRTRAGDAIGFLDVAHAKMFDWHVWQPYKPTVIIVDYAARETELIARILKALSRREDLNHTVRLVMLERDITATWFDRAILRGSANAIEIEDAWSGEDGFVAPPEDLWPIFTFIAGERDTGLPARAEALAELERIDPQGRPLYAAFLADAFARGEDPRRWDAYALVENVLSRERRYWDEGGAQTEHVNLCASATISGGVPAEWIENLSDETYKRFWPSWRGNRTLDAVSAIYGEMVVDDVPPLEPDILGEVFVLEYWAHASRFESARLLHYGAAMAPWFAEFLERAVSDFPTRSAFDLLYKALYLDFNDYANAKPELLYNLVLALVKDRPDEAIKAYWMFEALVPDQVTDNIYECVVDATFNLIVGSSALDFKDAMTAYRFQKLVSAGVQNDLALDRSRCALGASFLAKFPGEDCAFFRIVLADTLRTYRRHPNDLAIYRDTCIALCNYIDRLREDCYDEALRWLVHFERIATGDRDPEISKARDEILYHILLLGVARRRSQTDIVAVARKAFQEMVARAGVCEDAYRPLLQRLISDIQGDGP